MLRLNEIQKIFENRRWNLAQVSREAGIPYGSLYACLKKDISPRYHLVEKLSDYLESRNGNNRRPRGGNGGRRS
jgi:predicted transcriptional regulator